MCRHGAETGGRPVPAQKVWVCRFLPTNKNRMVRADYRPSSDDTVVVRIVRRFTYASIVSAPVNARLALALPMSHRQRNYRCFCQFGPRLGSRCFWNPQRCLRGCAGLCTSFKRRGWYAIRDQGIENALMAPRLPVRKHDNAHARAPLKPVGHRHSR
jgi:hypothetical protein